VCFRRTVRKTTEKSRRKAIRRTSPRAMRAADKSSTGTSSSDSDNYKHFEITDKSSQDDTAFWGTKPVASRMRSSSTNSDSSSNESGSRKASREHTPEFFADAKKNVTELKELFGKRSPDDLVTTRRSPEIPKRKFHPVSDERPAISMQTKPNLSSDSPQLPLRPKQSEIVRAHFAVAFTSTQSERKVSSSSMDILPEVQSELEASMHSAVSNTKAKKAPPTPPRKDSLQNSPTVSPRAQRRSSSAEPDRVEATPQKSDDNAALQDKAMEAILKVLIQKNGPELQNLVKQAIATDPELLKLALSDNQ